MDLITIITFGIAIFLTATVLILGLLFMFAPDRGMAFATHHPENLPSVMANRYFTNAALMIGALLYGKPVIIAFVFIATGYGAAHDAVIYARAGQPYKKHILPAVLSTIVGGGAFLIYLTSGAI